MQILETGDEWWKRFENQPQERQMFAIFVFVESLDYVLREATIRRPTLTNFGKFFHDATKTWVMKL